MTKETMIKNYRKFSAHDAYIIVFKERKDFYFPTMGSATHTVCNLLVERKRTRRASRYFFTLKKM